MWEAVSSWFLGHGILILFILLFAYISFRLVKTTIPHLVQRTVRVRSRGRHAKEEQARRSRTLSGFITTTVGITIAVAAVFMVLSEVGIDITPLLAGAGVIGIAVGFGAQSLIKDFLSGLFIVLEDQYSKGDVVRIAGIAGLVEDINLRRTVLRDLDGIVHSIPNGQITTASNFTRNWSRVNLNIEVAYGEDLDRVIEVINRVGQELTEDQYFGKLIRKAPQVLRVNKLGNSGIEIKILGETKPIKQWEVTGELRKRLKATFDEEGIEIPWPHLKLYLGGGQQDKGLICSSCSRPNLSGGSFCSSCGAKL